MGRYRNVLSPRYMILLITIVFYECYQELISKIEKMINTTLIVNYTHKTQCFDNFLRSDCIPSHCVVFHHLLIPICYSVALKNKVSTNVTNSLSTRTLDTQKKFSSMVEKQQLFLSSHSSNKREGWIMFSLLFGRKNRSLRFSW